MHRQWTHLAVLGLLVAAAPIASAAAGDEALRTDAVHAMGRSGAGVLVAVIDVGFSEPDETLMASIAGTRGYGDATGMAGDALARGVLASAPDAKLLLITVPSVAQLDAALGWAAEQGADVAVIGLGSTDGPFDGTSAPSRAVTRAVERGVIVLASAGDSARHHWMGNWTDKDGDSLLEFAPSDQALAVDVPAGGRLKATLSWDTTEDYDLFVYSNDMKVPLAWSTSYQSSEVAARETVSWTSDEARRVQLVVRSYRAMGLANFHLHLDPSGPALAERAVAEGSLLIPSDATGVIAVSAADPATLAPRASSGRGPSDGLGPAAALWATGMSPREAAGRAAGVAAIVAGERPGITPTEASQILTNASSSGTLDALVALALADDTPPSIVSATETGPVGAGSLPIRILFDDELLPLSGGTVRLAAPGGKTAPVVMQSISGREWRGVALVPSDFPNGIAKVSATGVEDWAGNAMATQTGGAILIDTLPPKIATLSAPAMVAGGVPLTWAVEDASPVTVRIESSLDGVTWTPWLTAQPASANATFDAADGARPRFRLTTEDAAKNVATAVSEPTLVDLSAPTIERASPAPGSESTALRPPIQATARDEGSGIDPTGFQLQLDGSVVAHTYDAVTGRISFLPTGDLGIGEHRGSLTARDRVGLSSTAEWSFTILAPPPPPVVAPVVSLPEEPPAEETTDASSTASGTDGSATSTGAKGSTGARASDASTDGDGTPEESTAVTSEGSSVTLDGVAAATLAPTAPQPTGSWVLPITLLGATFITLAVLWIARHRSGGSISARLHELKPRISAAIAGLRNAWSRMRDRGTKASR